MAVPVELYREYHVSRPAWIHRGPAQSYRETAADEYDPAGLEGCRTTGVSLTVGANSQQSVARNVKALRSQ